MKDRSWNALLIIRGHHFQWVNHNKGLLKLEANGQILDHEHDWRTTLLGPRDTIYERGNSLISPDRTKHKKGFFVGEYGNRAVQWKCSSETL